MGRLAGLLALVALVVGLGWVVWWSPAESAGSAAPLARADDTPPPTPPVKLVAPGTADPALLEQSDRLASDEVRATSPVEPDGPEPEDATVSARVPALPAHTSEKAPLIVQGDVPAQRRASLTVQVMDQATGKFLHDSQGSLVQGPSMPTGLPFSPRDADADGRLRFEGLAPGSYYLTVMRGLVMVQREVELIAGQARDLGRIALNNGPGTLIRVVDKKGQPVPCLVEIAVWEGVSREGGSIPAMDVEALYSGGTSHLTDERGTYLMPLPIRASLVRARPAPSPENGFAALPVWTWIGTATRDSRTAEIKLVTRELIETSFTFDPYAPWSEGDRLEITSAVHNLSYFQGHPPSEPLRLLTGYYSFEHWAGDELLAATEHLPIPPTLGMTSCTVRLP